MKFIKADVLREKPSIKGLKFGTVFTDYMLEMDYENGKWGEITILPYHNFDMAPSTMCLHYGQGIFEGCKAYRNDDGRVALFRIDDNFRRMNRSAARMCMPQIDVDEVKDALIKLISMQKDWIPTEEGSSLYIRPSMIATEEAVGVKVSSTYKFFIIMSPVGPYLHGIDTAGKIWVEDNYVRAAVGGTGEAKCIGNYAAGMLAQYEALQKGYEQVLWLDSKEHKYIEEVGTMNVMFVIDGEVITPALNGSILRGITRHSVIKVLREAGYTVREERIWIDDLLRAQRKNKLTEMFGVGTAAVISPVGMIGYQGEDYIIGDGKPGEVARFAYTKLEDIRKLKCEDTFGWMTIID